MHWTVSSIHFNHCDATLNRHRKITYIINAKWQTSGYEAVMQSTIESQMLRQTLTSTCFFSSLNTTLQLLQLCNLYSTITYFILHSFHSILSILIFDYIWNFIIFSSAISIVFFSFLFFTCSSFFLQITQNKTIANTKILQVHWIAIFF